MVYGPVSFGSYLLIERPFESGKRATGEERLRLRKNFVAQRAAHVRTANCKKREMGGGRLNTRGKSRTAVVNFFGESIRSRPEGQGIQKGAPVYANMSCITDANANDLSAYADNPVYADTS